VIILFIDRNKNGVSTFHRLQRSVKYASPAGQLGSGCCLAVASEVDEVGGMFIDGRTAISAITAAV